MTDDEPELVVHSTPETLTNSSEVPGPSTEMPTPRSKSRQSRPNPSLSSQLKIPLPSVATTSSEKFGISENETVTPESGNSQTPSDNNIQDARKEWSSYFGLLLAIMSSLMFSINALIFKILNYNPPLIPAFYMFLGTALLMFPLYLYHRYRNNSKQDTVDIIDEDLGLGTVAILGVLLTFMHLILHIYPHRFNPHNCLFILC